MTLTYPYHEHPLQAAAETAPDKSTRSRLLQFVAFQHAANHHWLEPDLAAYNAHLTERGLSASTRKAYLTTVRAAYKKLLRQNATRDAIAADIPDYYPDGKPLSLSDKLAAVNERITRLHNHLNGVTVRTPTIQDRADSEQGWLSPAQARQLMHAPRQHAQNHPLRSLRDTAIITLMLATGLREAEVCLLEVRDLRQRLDGELAVRVRQGKGAKQRLVPYGDLSGCLVVVERWLADAAVTEGPVFIGLDRWDKPLYTAMSRRSIQRLLKRYPLIIDGAPVTVHPHDLRRTYARMLYRAGLPLTAIQENLGHASIETTRGYIGSESGARRRGRNGYNVDFTQLVSDRLL